MDNKPAVFPLQLQLLFLLTVLLLFVDVGIRQWIIRHNPSFFPFNILPPFAKLMNPSEDDDQSCPAMVASAFTFASKEGGT